MRKNILKLIFILLKQAFISRKPQYKEVYRRTIEMPQCARTFQVNCCLKVHNAHLKLLSPISGKDILKSDQEFITVMQILKLLSCGWEMIWVLTAMVQFE